MNKTLKQLMIGVAIASLSSCASEEPLNGDSSSNRTTRSEIDGSVTCRTLSQAEVLNKASFAVNKKPSILSNASVRPVMAQEYLHSPSLLSDTVAYVVNYNNDGGFAVIANDSRIEEALAYSDHGNLTDENPIVKVAFLDKIEYYLHSLSSDGRDKESSGTINAPTRHFVIDPQIEIEIGPTDPFDKVVVEHYPKCKTVGTVNVAAATIISHFIKTMTYHNYYYNFETINYALNQGPGFGPVNPGIEIIQPNALVIPPMQFIYSYEGSVSAYAQLLYDLGQDSNTEYTTTAWTVPWRAANVLKGFGLNVSTISISQSITDIYSKLNDENLILLTLMYHRYDGEPINFPVLEGPLGAIIDGCDMIIDKEGKIISGMVHCVFGCFGIGDGFYSYPILLSDNAAYVREICHYGIKAGN